MIVLTILLHIIAAIVIFLLALIVLILVVPIEYEAQGFRYEEDMGVNAAASWLMGLVNVQYSVRAGVRQRLDLRLFGFFRKNLLALDVNKQKNKELKASKAKDKEKHKKKSPFSMEKLKVILRSAKRIIKSYRPRYFSVDATVGFEDAYHTGLLCAGVQTLKPALEGLGQMRIAPVFNEEIIEGRFDIAGRIIPAVALIEGLRVIFSKPFRKNYL